MTRAERGFTLVELIVVIVIIGIVAGLVTANLIGARQRARDAQRKSDLRQIQAALELYRADAGAYPSTGNFPACGNRFVSGTTVYIQKTPCDPQPTNTQNSYRYQNSGDTYTLTACLENSNDPQVIVLMTERSWCEANYGASRYPFVLFNP